jgi:hypothetical protein
MNRVNRILFINDDKSLNVMYRADLIAELQNEGYEVCSLGVSSPWDFMSLVKNAFLPLSLIVSSNLRANLASCLFCWLPGIVIVNGLGRYKRIKFFRRLILIIFSCCWKRFFVIQNYGDFRYFRRFSNASIFWIPGSGGSIRKTASRNALFVSRPSKLPSQLASIEVMVDELGLKEVNVIGVGEGDLVGLPRYLKLKGVTSQMDLFSEGNIFLQPSGYGEGVPHTLVDAICSGMIVYISYKDYVQFGFYKLECGFTGAKIGTLTYCESLKSTLSLKQVNKDYINIIKLSIERWHPSCI